MQTAHLRNDYTMSHPPPPPNNPNTMQNNTHPPRRCWNCWSLHHELGNCPQSPKTIYGCEKLRIRLGVPWPGRAYEYRLRGFNKTCFNCWKQNHSEVTCPDVKRSIIDAEKLRAQMGVGMVDSWRKLLVKKGYMPLNEGDGDNEQKDGEEKGRREKEVVEKGEKEEVDTMSTETRTLNETQNLIDIIEEAAATLPQGFRMRSSTCNPQTSVDSPSLLDTDLSTIMDSISLNNNPPTSSPPSSNKINDNSKVMAEINESLKRLVNYFCPPGAMNDNTGNGRTVPRVMDWKLLNPRIDQLQQRIRHLERGAITEERYWQFQAKVDDAVDNTREMEMRVAELEKRVGRIEGMIGVEEEEEEG